MVSLGVI